MQHRAPGVTRWAGGALGLLLRQCMIELKGPPLGEPLPQVRAQGLARRRRCRVHGGGFVGLEVRRERDGPQCELRSLLSDSTSVNSVLPFLALRQKLPILRSTLWSTACIVSRCCRRALICSCASSSSTSLSADS
mmetsp:Transcript_61784/g.152132  ORF Transcript_61784/g.152132 Transcript_61784/m.152132 type:complete len:135 (+) Transcript_61784:98-502(+)